MRLEMDMRYVSGYHRGELILPQIAESALQAIALVAMTSDTEKELANCIGTISLEFGSDHEGVNASMSADVVVLMPGAVGIRSSKVVKCSAKFELGTSCPTEKFAGKILEAVAQATGIIRNAKRPVAA